MNNYFGVSIVILYLYIMFISTGYICEKGFHLKADRLLQPIYGAIVYFLILVMIYIPIQFTNKSLSLFRYIVWSISVLVMIASLIFLVFDAKCKSKKLETSFRNYFNKIIQSYKKNLTKSNFIYFFNIVIFIVFIVVFTNCNTYYGSKLDASYYNGIINTMVYTDGFDIYDAYTGSATWLPYFQWIRFYEAFIALISKMFFIHPLIVVNRIMPLCEMLTYMYLIFLISRRILQNCKRAILVVGIVFLINFCMDSIYTSAYFLFYRIGEAKSITANITLPLILLFFCHIYEEKENNVYWSGLIGTIIVGLAINDSALFLIPTILFCLFVPLNYKIRKGKVLYKSLACFVPCIFFIVLYYYNNIAGLLYGYFSCR